VGAGLALTTGEQSQAKGKHRGKARSQGQVTAQGRGKKITICYQGQTRVIKKSKLGNYPGATRGACPPPPGGGGGGTGGGGQQPAVCSRWIISGGPNQTDKIVVDDDLGIWNMSQGGAGILNDFDARSSTLSPVVFDAKVGDQLRIYAYDRGGCRSLSPLWLHCSATGKSRQLFNGYNGTNCNYSVGGFVEEFRDVWV
jgi:hypothetical protein